MSDRTPRHPRPGARKVLLGAALFGATALGLGFGPGAGEASAQTVERVQSDGQVPCSGCTLTFGPEVVLAEPPGDPWGFPPLQVAFNSRGHLLVANVVSVREFDPQGNFVRHIGGEGEGPGEFERAGGVVVLPEDSVAVFHRHGISIYDSEGTFVRKEDATLATNRRPIRLETGHLVSQQNLDSRSVSPSVHVYNLEGERHSFGPETRRTSSGQLAVDWRHLSASADNTFWMAPRAPYRLERWNTRGEQTLVLEREADHHPHQEFRTIYEGGRVVDQTTPSLAAVWEDAEGRVWTSVADRIDGGGATTPMQDRRYESIIEVLDPRTGELLGTGRVPGTIRHFGRGHRLLSIESGDDGGWRVTVRQARLEVPERH